MVARYLEKEEPIRPPVQWIMLKHTKGMCPPPSVNLSANTLTIHKEVYLGLLDDSKSIQVDNEDELFHSLYTYANLYFQFLSLTLRPIDTQVHSVLILGTSNAQILSCAFSTLLTSVRKSFFLLVNPHT